MHKIENSVNIEVPVSITYSDTTPQSIEHGGYEDVGFIHKDTTMTIHALAETINHCESSSWPIIEDNLNNLWFTGPPQTIDYTEGRKRKKSYHFNGGDIALWKKVIKLSDHELQK